MAADPIPLRRAAPPIVAGDLAGAPQPPDANPDQLVTVEEGADGGVDIIIKDHPPVDDAKGNSKFDENLAERDELRGSLDAIASELLEGIEADERSRSAWVENYNEGLDLLGLRITKGTQVSTETLSSVTHPILLEAVLRFRALALGEILPAAGPAKVRNDGAESDERQLLADDLETDINHWLTTIATEYYPDTDRGLIYCAFGGNIFKKVYRDPVRQRPVSECVFLPDLIVSQDVTDLDNATRVTHRIDSNKLYVKRMVEAGWFVDTSLSEPVVNPDAVARKEKELQGIAPVPQRQEDYTRTLLECYTYLDLDDIPEKGAPDLPLPYRVTIDKDSRKILELRRNWRQGDKEFRKRQRFVKWRFMPGMGFYDLGYLHILGQHAKALTAIMRISIDSGMLGNFPGFIKLKGARMDTNQIRPAPGEAVEVDGGAGVMKVSDVIMPLPYKDLSPQLLALMATLEDSARKLAGTVDLESGEGRTNVPVGTIMATIEQQTQMMTAVHKGMHQSQQEEFILLRELFAEDPESLTRGNPHPKRQWTREMLADMSLVPASDPNVPAHIHRLMQAWALAQLSQGSPLYDQFAVQKRLLEVLRISNPDELLVQPQNSSPAATGDAAAQPGLPPAALVAIAQETLKQGAAKIAAGQAKDQSTAQLAAKKQQDDFHLAMTEIQTKAQQAQDGLSDSEADRASREAIADLQAQTQLILKGLDAANAAAIEQAPVPPTTTATKKTGT